MIDDATHDPRRGAIGLWDQLAGPGADPSQLGIILGALIAGPGLAIAWARAAGADWSWWQWFVLGLLASELTAGLAANALTPAKVWRHRRARGPRTHFLYCALHIHSLVLALAMPDGLSLRGGFIMYGLLLAGAGLTLAAPIKIRPAVGLLYSAAAIAVCGIWVPLTSPMGWIPAVLYPSLLAGYLIPPPETPMPRGPWS